MGASYSAEAKPHRRGTAQEVPGKKVTADKSMDPEGSPSGASIHQPVECDENAYRKDNNHK
jgi:hypothetical protein